jgi:hypothetical protein
VRSRMLNTPRRLEFEIEIEFELIRFPPLPFASTSDEWGVNGIQIQFQISNSNLQGGCEKPPSATRRNLGAFFPPARNCSLYSVSLRVVTEQLLLPSTRGLRIRCPGAQGLQLRPATPQLAHQKAELFDERSAGRFLSTDAAFEVVTAIFERAGRRLKARRLASKSFGLSSEGRVTCDG